MGKALALWHYKLGNGVLYSDLSFTWSPDFLHPWSKTLQESVLLPKMQVFAKREPLGKLGVQPKTPAYDLHTLFPVLPSMPSAAKPISQPIHDVLKTHATLSHCKAPHLGNKSYCPLCRQSSVVIL